MELSYFANPWVVFAGLVFLFLCLVEAYYRSRRWLLIPRFIWIALVCFLIAEWSFVISEDWSEPRPLKVFIDESDSIQILSDRKARAEEFKAGLDAWADEARQPVQYYSFSEQVTLGFPNWEKPGFVSSLQNLKDLIDSEDGHSILVGDGNYLSPERFSKPVHALLLGDSNEKDIWLERLDSVYTAFLKNRISIQFDIGQTGYEGQEVQVELLKNNEVLVSKKIVLKGESTAAEISYFPEKMGEEVLAIRVVPKDQELSEVNNISIFELRTVRDKIRILHIGGKPSLDLKAWRLFLTKQPDVDLVSFYILRSLNDDPEARNDELSLIPFPYDELFTTELEKFDVVILQNFNFALYFQPFYLRNLARFVENGGGLLMMGGDQSFHRYALSPLSSIIPFEIDSASFLEGGRFKAKLQSQHPILEGVDWAFTKPLWETRHRLKKMPGAEDLIVFEDGTPFLSLLNYREGRVLAFNTDESWRMQFQVFGDFVPFNRIARRALQYLTFDPTMERLRIQSSEWKVGETVSLKLSGSKVGDWKVSSLYWNTDFERSFNNQNQIDFLVPHAGVYEVTHSSLKESFVFQTEERPWRNEWKNLVSNLNFLKKVAGESGGEFRAYSDYEDLFQKSLGGQQMIATETQPWLRFSKIGSWLILACILIFLCLDFFLRKRFQWDL